MDASGNNTARNSALDFTKGTLVLFMVLYHWINYFVSTEGLVYTYLRFITPSFIFIAGFVIASVYPEKYGFESSRVYQRLISRGLKILVLFTALNVAANILFTSSYKGSMPGIAGFMRNASSIYISGNGKAAFGILVPISYLLFSAAGVFFFCKTCKYSIYLVSAVLFFFLIPLDLYYLSSSNLELIAIGLLGLALGFYPIERINNWIDHPYLIACLNVVYLLAISIWGVRYLLQIIGVCLSVLLIYMIGLKSSAWGEVQNQIILLGKYSLFGYISQIAVLHLLHQVLSPFNFQTGVLWSLSFIGAFALTVTIVNIVHATRGKSPTVNWLYRAAFS